MEDAQKKSEEYLSAVKKSEWGNIESMSQNLGNKVVVDNSDFLYDKLWQVIGEIGKNKTDDQYNILVGRELIDGYKITSFVRDPKQPDDLRKRCDGMRITVSNGKHTKTYYRAVDSLNYKGE